MRARSTLMSASCSAGANKDNRSGRVFDTSIVGCPVDPPAVEGTAVGARVGTGAALAAATGEARMGEEGAMEEEDEDDEAAAGYSCTSADA